MTTSDIFQLTDFLKNTVDLEDEYSVSIENINQGQGDSYMGQIVYATLTHKRTRKNIYLVIKQPRLKEDGTFSNYTDPHFENEIWFYQTIWSTLKNYYEETVKKTLHFIPTCYGVSKNGIYKIALENEKKNGFVPFDRTRALDNEYFLKLFQTYGIFHGISMALRIKCCEEFTRIMQGVVNRWDLVFTDGKYVAEMLKTLAGYSKKYFNTKTEHFAIEKLEIFSKIGPKLVRECLKKSGSNEVILHGDCWSNNFLFKYDENGKLQDLRIIDFQTPCIGSPVYDLSYCFYSGATGKNYDDLDYYLKIYHDSLSATLAEFNLDAEMHFSFTTLKEEWKKFCIFGFAMSFWVGRLKLVDKDNAPDITDYDGNELQPVKLLEDKEEQYKQFIRDLVFHLCKHDFF